MFICYRWARELGGPAAGTLAACLWALEPNMLACTQLVTPEIAAAAMGLTMFYVYRGWLREPTWRRAAAAGLLLGATLLSKTTWVVAVGLLPLVWLVCRLAVAPGAGWRRELAQLAAILAVALYTLNLGYGFEGTGRRLGEFTFLSAPWRGDAEREIAGHPAGNRFAGSWLGSVPVPLPSSLIEGIDYVRTEFERGYASQLLGEHKHGGWWYYYVLGMLWKIPLGFWVLVGVALLEVIRARDVRLMGEAAYLAVPALLVVVLVSSHTGYTHHLRYVVPAFPLGFVLAGQAARSWQRGSRLLGALAASALAWGVSSSMFIAPHQLCYFNELVAGPHGGMLVMGLGSKDSTFNWGQDTLLLRDWMAANPDVPPLDGIALWGVMESVRGAAGLGAARPPRDWSSEGRAAAAAEDLCQFGPRPGWYAVDVKQVHGDWSQYRYFARLKPYATVGYTIHVYHVSAAEADRAWEQIHGASAPRSGCCGSE